jgi:hypothetical protein
MLATHRAHAARVTIDMVAAVQVLCRGHRQSQFGHTRLTIEQQGMRQTVSIYHPTDLSDGLLIAYHFTEFHAFLSFYGCKSPVVANSRQMPTKNQGLETNLSVKIQLFHHTTTHSFKKELFKRTLFPLPTIFTTFALLTADVPNTHVVLLKAIIAVHHGRQDDTGAAASLHEPHQGTRHQTRAGGAAMVVASGIPLSAVCEIVAGETRHCDAQVENCDFCQRLLLARA